MSKIKVIKGDITTTAADAIVNAANSSLLGGGGVDGAIHRTGPGESVITTAGNLPAKFVIHTVGPVWNGGNRNEAGTLANCYLNSLKLAAENGCQKIAFPNISTGAYGCPKNEAAKVSVAAIRDFLRHDSTILEVIVVCFDDENFNAVQDELGITC